MTTPGRKPIAMADGRVTVRPFRPRGNSRQELSIVASVSQVKISEVCAVIIDQWADQHRKKRLDAGKIMTIQKKIP